VSAEAFRKSRHLNPMTTGGSIPEVLEMSKAQTPRALDGSRMRNSTAGVLLGILEKILEAVTMVGFIGMLLATGGQVMFRYVLQVPVPWTEELARMLFIVTMFLGIAIAIREQEHIVVDFLFKKLPTGTQALGLILFNGSVFVFLCFLARGTVIMMRVTWGSYMIAIDWVRTGYLYFAELIAILFMMLYVLLAIVQNLKALRTGERS